MDRSKCSIIVSGATGRQGGAVARKLVMDGWDVHALVRDPDKPAARALAGLGVTLEHGDLYDPDSIAHAVAGAYGVFSVQSWSDGVEAEERQGVALAEAAADAHVEHFVYCSVGGAERDSGVPHFESKWHVEESIRRVGLPFTIWRPVYFMENLLWQRDAICEGTLTPPIDAEIPLQFIAVEDIASFVALSFRTPGAWLGHATEIAGDECSFAQVAQMLSAMLGTPITVAPLVRPVEAERQVMARWFEQSGYCADIDRLRHVVADLCDLPTWARKNFSCSPVWSSQRG